MGRELLRLDLLECAPGKFSTFSPPPRRPGNPAEPPTDHSHQTNRPSRRKPPRRRPGAIECDELLFERLRALRRQLADERGVPAYIIFSDVSLREMARKYPTNSTEFRRIPGVGEQKLKDYAEPFLAEIRKYLAKSPRRIFPDEVDSSLQRRQVRLNDSQTDTLRRFQSGETVEQIARAAVSCTARFTVTFSLRLNAASSRRQEHDSLHRRRKKKSLRPFARFPMVRTDISAILRNKYDIGLLRIFRALNQRKTVSPWLVVASAKVAAVRGERRP